MPTQPVTREEFWHTRDRIVRVLRSMEVILLVLVLVLTGMGYWSLHLQMLHTSDANTLRHQRELSIIESCKSQNVRNYKLSVFLNQLPVAHKGSRKQKQLLSQFVDALAPHEDCHAALLRRTGKAPSKKPIFKKAIRR